MIPRLKKLNTLRNQIFAVFLFVMIIVLSIVSMIVYNQVGNVMKENAAKQIQQTAIEANGRMETLYNQIDTLSNQLATNGTVQQLLFNIVNGESIDFAKRQSLLRVINNIHAYSDGISSIELYTASGNRVYPFNDNKLSNVIDDEWVKMADQEKGRLVWVGKDQKDQNYSYAIRRVSLMERWYSNGGYLVVRIYNSYFQVDDNRMNNVENDYMMLLDRDLSPITTDYGIDIQNFLLEKKKTITIDKKEYLIVTEQSKQTGWTLVILKPTSFLMENVSTVRPAILFSVAIGFFLFFVSSMFLATIITRPIKRLTNTMKNAKMDELKKNPESMSSLEIIELNKTYNQMVDNTNHLIQEVYEKEILRSRTELKALQAQINPHFLYNTLNALYWSLEEKGEEELAETVIAMSELFRYTIGKSNNDEWVTIQDELEHIERFLQLMKMRLGDRLQWEIVALKEFDSVKIPKLMIQPLVENAILHGIENKRRQGFVSIIVEKAHHSSNITIKVKDNGMGIEHETLNKINRAIENDYASSMKGIGMALTNVNKRLQLYYDQHNLKNLSLMSKQGNGTIVTFEIPIIGGN
ncbi:sensor histidine kinase [Metabacillus sediminilitoris]|uniref:histidine kinase n=1 Tax=Metabacillus sediminilitoris TaxID=2567941 RepID=A0A4S4C0I5_9BACI|nr:sensor histidine kinase [Metabacillus sediminilitoris]QGQ47769.1 HAMP domain-containing protein [Metabacillus sediminilitoris]THF81118.1 sensor histidine kinase [Metabacillus sediminilitoris]